MNTLKHPAIEMFWFCLLTCFSVACAQIQITPTRSTTFVAAATPTQTFFPSINSPNPDPSVTPTLYYTPRPHGTMVRTATPVPTETSTPTPSPTPITLIPPPQGLIYSTDEGEWLVIGLDGETRLLIDQPYGEYSPDFSQYLYIADDDIWLANLSSDERYNVTQTPDRVECCAQWWPMHPNKIIFNSWPVDSLWGHDYSLGMLTTIFLDGSGYELLDTVVLPQSQPAISPMNGAIIYNDDMRLWQDYRISFALELFDLIPATDLSMVYVESFSWSPDGRYVAVMTTRRTDDQSNNIEGLILFDFETMSATYIYEYVLVAGDSSASAPSWSSNGQFLAFLAREKDETKGGLWIVEPQTQRTIFSPQTHTQIICPYEIVWHPVDALLVCGYSNYLLDLNNGVVYTMQMAGNPYFNSWKQ